MVVPLLPTNYWLVIWIPETQLQIQGYVRNFLDILNNLNLQQSYGHHVNQKPKCLELISNQRPITIQQCQDSSQSRNRDLLPVTKFAQLNFLVGNTLTVKKKSMGQI